MCPSNSSTSSLSALTMVRGGRASTAIGPRLLRGVCCCGRISLSAARCTASVNDTEYDKSLEEF